MLPAAQKRSSGDPSSRGRELIPGSPCPIANLIQLALTTAYNILRSLGIELGKRDFMGQMPS